MKNDGHIECEMKMDRMFSALGHLAMENFTLRNNLERERERWKSLNALYDELDEQNKKLMVSLSKAERELSTTRETGRL